jgi:hypothetical protein
MCARTSRKIVKQSESDEQGAREWEAGKPRKVAMAAILAGALLGALAIALVRRRKTSRHTKSADIR